MNWYQIFYWVTVADGVKGFFDAISNWFIGFSVIFLLAWIILFFMSQDEGSSEEDRKSCNYFAKRARQLFIWSFTLMTITWSLYVFCPSKKDAIIIIAGGSIGNFITSDSSSKQIPAELTLLIREKLRSEIEEIKNPTSVADTLATKTKEELIEMLKNK